ncbi:MAG: InlB B-repeat-containing protein, partial [Coriobacteriia bacterium]|nr:InlB B-repeat-containing protein [Coriobacteriia bacterium]
SGRVSIYLSGAAIAGLAESTVSLVIVAKVNSTWVSGDIVNVARIYYQRDKEVIPNPNTSTPDESTDVTVPYRPVRYTLTYNANSGVNAPIDPNSPYIRGTQVVVLGQGGMYRTGYNFVGWATSSTGPAVYGAGSRFNINSNTTLYAVWALIPITPPTPTTYTVSYLPGAYGTFAPQVTTGLAFGAATPAAPAVTGQDGWEFIGWAPAVQPTVTGSISYIAQWAETEPDTHIVIFLDWNDVVLKVEEVPDGQAATPPEDPSREGYEFVGWDQDFTNVTSDMTIRAVYELIDEPTIVPLTPGDRAWALLNLILAVIGVVLAIATLISYFSKRKETEEDEESNVQTTSRKRFALRIFNAILAVTAVILFLLTEDMTQPMIFVDWWTIFHIIIFILQAIATVLVRNKKEDEEELQKPDSLAV